MFLRKLLATFLLVLVAPAHAATGPLLSVQTLTATPVADVSARFAGRTRSNAPGAAYEFAWSAAIALSSSTDGQWSVDGTSRIWRLDVHSQDAVNMSLTLAAVNLPRSAEVRLYDADGLLWHGPWSATELQRHEQFWTPIVPGSHALIELRMNAGDGGELRIEGVNHGYDELATAKSGSCNIDVACSTADAWTDAVRATARITIGGRRLCTAVLLNNTRENGDPLLLTARHCGISQDGEFPASSVVAYWNFERSRCGGSDDGNLRQNQSGSDFLASDATADFTLLRLSATPPASYQVHYAGWDARGLAPVRGVSVHHPSGDEKSISFFENGARARAANVDGNSVQAWEVIWSRGITEAGSSGSGLWNATHQVIGQLSGGNSSCDNPDGPDVYGRLDAGWQAGTRIDEQLRPWLDPDNSGTRQMDGRDGDGAGLNTRSDHFTNVPADRNTLRLDVLSNDGGPQPLRLTGVRAQSGQALLNEGHLVYQFAEGHDTDLLSYDVIDRWGNTQTNLVTVSRELTPAGDTPRGGALHWGALLILILGLRRRLC